MTETKKLRKLQEYIDKGLDQFVIIELKDAMDKEHPVRDKITIAELYKMVESGEEGDLLGQFPNFKEIFKSADKERTMTIGVVYKDTLEKVIEGLKKEKKIGSPDDDYMNSLK